MSQQKNLKAEKAEVGSKAQQAPDTLDEIDQIMNEIEELQQGMNAAQSAPAVAAASAAPAPDDSMSEFQSGAGEASLEETLGSLQDEEPSGPNLIDQAIAAEAAAQGASSETTDDVPTEDDTELLDEAEAEALDAAIADEESQIAGFVESSVSSHSNEEPIQMHESTQRRRSVASGSSVSVKLSGDMTLQLSYEYEGQDVTIAFVDGSLQVQLSDGTEFKIPVRRKSLRKAA